jgi:uncharacterized protein
VTTRLLLLADTHVPRRARDLPPAVWAQVASCDVVVHAGDWVEPALLDALLQRLTDPARERPGRLVGVHGNNDGAELRRRLPEVARVDVDGLALAVVHETGEARGREARCEADPRFAEADVLVFGHSHIPWDTTTPRGLRLLNPGSPTDRRPGAAGNGAHARAAGAPEVGDAGSRHSMSGRSGGDGRPAPGGRGAGHPPG